LALDWIARGVSESVGLFHEQPAFAAIGRPDPGQGVAADQLMTTQEQGQVPALDSLGDRDFGPGIVIGQVAVSPRIPMMTVPAPY
jgi:hypothetical protein